MHHLLSDILKNAIFYSDERVSISELSFYNYVTTDNLLQNKLGKVNVEKLPSKGGNVTKFSEGDILISNIRPYLKKIWLAKYDGGSSADVLTFKVKPNYDSTFVYYSLFRDDFFDYVMKGSKGTKMPRGDKKQILNFQISNFEINVQQKIAKVLSDLDVKIELNNKINLELETMAKTLYDYWFVQFDFPDANGKTYKTSGGKMIWI
jgi:type I restriction enzyme S subunit|nr:restriction endonuclease subunit S [uncultured Flavobacterium sp.]